MGQVNFDLWFDNLTLGPGESGIFFEDNISQTKTKKGCWFAAVPINPLTADFIANGQMIEITHVFHIVKGKNRALGSAGGTGTLQVYVTVRNFNPVNPVTFQLYKAEIGKWQVVIPG
ncbi:MAG: hypothetical protein HYR94_24620 [Chloroflexi bacterium]|nr:hypothetical protein [Chloroflexota bacterium]